MKRVDEQKPRWFVSPMFDHAKRVSIEAHSILFGYRMKPGVRIAENKLLKSIQEMDDNIDDILNRLTDYSNRSHSVEEALNCLATDVSSVKQAAKKLGVSSRTLQRLIGQATDRSPIYWMLLARARKAARALNESNPLADIAEMHGYADQSHMNREFKRWFGITPTTMRSTPSLLSQLSHAGYD
ncbi:MAG: AraC family transcriptional regulator [Gammaproteobacteria bacterium]|nr:AraC family transcriptional regulator [Gammaproteobacteria bacterium]